MFIERNVDLAKDSAYVAMITMQSWMFLSTFENLRSNILSNSSIVSMAHLGARAFDSIGGEVVSTTAFICKNIADREYKGTYLRLVDGEDEQEKSNQLKELKGRPYLASSDDFDTIPGRPIAYWISEKVRNAFAQGTPFGDVGFPKVGMQTSNNDKYLRLWPEVSFHEFKDEEMPPKWIKYLKGGAFRRWYGNLDYLLRYNKNPQFIKQQPNATVLPETKLKEAKCTWTDLTSGPFNARYAPDDTFHDISGHCFYPPRNKQMVLLAYSNTRLFDYLLSLINASFHFQVGDVAKIPVLEVDPSASNNASTLVSLSKNDWDSYETSWDFTSLPVLNPDYRQPTLKTTYQKLRAHWREMTLEMQRLEEENNRTFIDAYGLQDELKPEVPLNEITLTCNPHYRYGNDKSEDELEALLLADTMRELVSYAVGCMFGRYALDKPGLILANQGETIEDYLKRVPEPSFPADDDNVIPMLDGDWFTDDIAERFRKFLRVAFGEEHYEANLRFVEQALNIKGKRNYSIRDYFLGEFYTDHVKRYKKRPIYWLFSSPKGSFNALIYMHRYRPDTASVVLNDYLREFRTKLTSHKNHLEAVSISASSSQGEKTKALKEIEKITKMIAEMEEYEREVLYPLATEQVEIDLDDGVKVNYPKLGSALKKIPGLDAKED